MSLDYHIYGYELPSARFELGVSPTRPPSLAGQDDAGGRRGTLWSGHTSSRAWLFCNIKPASRIAQLGCSPGRAGRAKAAPHGCRSKAPSRPQAASESQSAQPHHGPLVSPPRFCISFLSFQRYVFLSFCTRSLAYPKRFEANGLSFRQILRLAPSQSHVHAKVRRPRFDAEDA
jgi:hypothetical protein